MKNRRMGRNPRRTLSSMLMPSAAGLFIVFLLCCVVGVCYSVGLLFDQVGGNPADGWFIGLALCVLAWRCGL